ncbi:fungal-specific transcription factor domain-containing protein [Mycena galopus ATCC 62051]|nr:fungal-specific transcription factor domain-containing protein [Mycena galopus ATCC 62051]
MYGSPLDARARQDRLNSERRFAETLHDKFTVALRTPASNDRAEPLFKDAELDVIYRNHTGARLPFFETRRAKTFMSSTNPHGHYVRKRPCDVCRRRKTGCYGSNLPVEKCNACIEAKLDCTYLNIPPKRKTLSYVEGLEARLKNSEARILALRSELSRKYLVTTSATHSLDSLPCTSVDTQRSETTSRGTVGDFDASSLRGRTEDENVDPSAAALHIMRATIASVHTPLLPPDPRDSPLDLSDEMDQLALGPLQESAFVGQSSPAAFIKAARALKANLEEVEPLSSTSRNGAQGSIDADSRKYKGGENTAWNPRRLDCWTRGPSARSAQRLEFPAEPLISELIALYFTRQNIYTPLLHRPTFERGLTERLHLRDNGFAATVLLVCAIGSRWSRDPSIAVSDVGCGREWFDQVPLTEDRLIGPATLYDLQYYCLAVIFLDASAALQACSTLVGIGLRLAQDIGLHVRRAENEVPSVMGELYKRAFSVLMYLDRLTSAEMGRTCALNYNDFDNEPLLEVDDHYWEDPVNPFRQPPGLPSSVSFFNTLTRLGHIRGFFLDRLYASNKLFEWMSTNSGWENGIITELHFALNTWREHVPHHLQFDPPPEDQVFFDQSVALHTAFYHLQLLIHRSLIPTFRKSSTSILPFLTISTTAARGCAKMVDAQRRRNGNATACLNLRAVFAAGHFLLLHVWNETRTGAKIPPEENRDLLDVQKCMEVLLLYKTRGVRFLPIPAPVQQLQPFPNEVSGSGMFDPAIEPSEFPIYTLDPQFALQDPPAYLCTTLEPKNYEFEDTLNAFDGDALMMWTSAPGGLE